MKSDTNTKLIQHLVNTAKNVSANKNILEETYQFPLVTELQIWLRERKISLNFELQRPQLEAVVAHVPSHMISSGQPDQYIYQLIRNNAAENYQLKYYYQLVIFFIVPGINLLMRCQIHRDWMYFICLIFCKESNQNMQKYS